MSVNKCRCLLCFQVLERYKMNGVTNFMARAAKKLAKEKGVLSTPNPKPGRSVPETIIEQVKRFYESDDVSRQMPGKKDCVAMNNGKKTTVQKRLILCNLKECYQKFKEKSVANIGFSKPPYAPEMLFFLVEVELIQCVFAQYIRM